MKKILIKNATLINEGYAGIASVLIEGDKIAAVYPEAVSYTHLDVYKRQGFNLEYK